VPRRALMLAFPICVQEASLMPICFQQASDCQALCIWGYAPLLDPLASKVPCTQCSSSPDCLCPTDVRLPGVVHPGLRATAGPAGHQCDAAGGGRCRRQRCRRLRRALPRHLHHHQRPQSVGCFFHMTTGMSTGSPIVSDVASCMDSSSTIDACGARFGHLHHHRLQPVPDVPPFVAMQEDVYSAIWSCYVRKP